MAKQLNVNLAFTADTGKAKAQLQDLQASLTNLMATAGKSTNGLGLTKDISEAINEVAKLQSILDSSKNASGGLDLGKFNQSLKLNKKTIEEYATSLNSIGPSGTQAFAKLAKSIITAEVPLKRTNKLLDEFKTSLANTARWQISSSILHGFMGSLQTAFGYAEDLNKSLNDIRIVTGQNTDQMAKFAREANAAAQALSATTTEYTNAALIYYQQGLNEEEVKARTDLTIKMANASGQSAEVVSDQLTAIWNNYAEGADDLEHFADVLTKLGAETASSSEEISIGLEKFAAIGDTIGLSYDNAAAALATVTATTRQSAEVVGTAFKTIFARIQGLNLGETLDDGTSLNKYSEALSKVGISIFEQSGEIKKMDDILDEMGAKWQTMNKDQQIALAQTVAGVRQYTQLVALMDNWDFYEQNLSSAQNADGSLQKQADIYAESWEAAQKRVKAASEEIYNQLLNDEFFIDLNNGFAEFLNVVSDTIDALGGLPGILTLSSGLMLKMFGPEMAKSIDDWAYNLQLKSKDGLKKILELRKEAVKSLREMYADNVNAGTPSNSASQIAYEQQATISDALLLKEQQLLASGKSLSEEKKREVEYIISINEQLGQQAIQQAKLLEQAEHQNDLEERRIKRKINAQRDKKVQEDPNNQEIFDDINLNLDQSKNLAIQAGELEKIHQKFNALEKQQKSFTLDNVINEFEELIESSGKAGLETGELNNTLEQLKAGGISVEEALNIIRTSAEKVGGKAYQSLDDVRTGLSNAKIAGEELDKSLEKLFDSWVKQGHITEEFAEKLKSIKIHGDNAVEVVEKLEADPVKLGQKIIGLTEGISSMATMITSIQGLMNTWNNDDMTGFEKFVSSMTSLSFVIPSVIRGMQSLNQVINIGLGPIGAIFAGVAILTTTLTYLDAQEKKLIETSKEAAKQSQEYAQSLKKEREEKTQLIQVMREEFDLYQKEKTNKEALDQATTNLAEAYNIEFQALRHLQGGYQDYNVVLEQATKKQREQLKELTDGYKEAQKNAGDAILNIANSKGTIALDSFSGADGDSSGEEKKAAEILKKNVSSAGVGTNKNYVSIGQGIDKNNIAEVIKVYDEVSEAFKQMNEQMTAEEKASSGIYEETKAWLDSLTESVNQYKEASAQLAQIEAQGKLINSDAKITNYTETAAWVEELKTQLLAAGMSAENLDIAIQSVVDESLNPQIKSLYDTYKAVEEVKDISSIADEKLAEIWNNKNLDKSALAFINWGSVTEKSFDKAYQSAKRYSDALKGAEKASKDLVSYQDALKAVGSGLDEEGVKELSTLLDWGSEKEGIMEFSDFLVLTTEQQQAYLKEKIKSSYQASVSSLKGVIEESEKIIAEEQKNQENLKGETASAKTQIQDWEDAEKAYKDYKIAQQEGNQELVDKLANQTRELKDENDNILSWQDLIALEEEEFKQILANATSKAQTTLDQWNLTESNLATAEANKAQAEEDLGVSGVNYANALGNVDDLKEALDSGLITVEEFASGLINLASAFENCAEEIHHYQRALQLGVGAEAAQEALKLSIYVGELAEKFDLSADGIENYAERLGEATENSELTKKALIDMAVASQRLDKGVSDINDNLKDYKKILKDDNKLTAEYSETMDKLKDNLADIFNVVDGDLFSDTFAEAMLASDDFKKVLDGDIEALDKLRAQATVDIGNTIIENLGEQAKVVYGELDAQGQLIENTAYTASTAWNYVKSILEDGFTLDEINTKSFVDSLNQMIQASGMTKEQIQSMLGSMGVSAEVVTDYIEQPTQVPTYTEVIEEGQKVQVQQGINSDGTPNYVEYTGIKKYSVPGEPLTVQGFVPTYSIKTTSGDKTSGGQIDYSQTFQKASPPKISKGSTTSGKKSGGSGGSSKPNKGVKKSDTIERYKEVNDALDDVTNALDDANKESDRLFGADKLKNIDKENKLILENIKLLNQKKKEAAANLEIDKLALEQTAEAAGVKLDIDPNSNLITNYTEAMTTLFNQLDEAHKKAGDTIEEAEQEIIDGIQEKIDNLKDAITQYDETRELMEDLDDEEREKRREIQDNNYEKLTYKLELDNIVTDNEMKELDYYLGKMEGDIEKAVEAFGILQDKLNTTSDKLFDYENHFNSLEQAYAAGQISQADYIDGLQECYDALYDNIEALNDLDKQMMEYYGETYDLALEKIETYTSQMEHLSSVLDHYKSIMSLLGKEGDFETMGVIIEGQVKVAEDSYKSSKSIYELAKGQKEAAYEELMSAENDAERELLQKNYDKALEEFNNAQETMLADAETYGELIKEALVNSMNQAAKEMEKALTGVWGSFENLQEQMGLHSTHQEEFLTNTNKLYETNKLLNQVAQDMEKTDNRASKAKYQAFSKEIEQLQEKDKLSKLELEIAQAKYNMLQAQIALEEAQNAKSMVRLSRDSEGNYGYVYTADKDKVNQAEQDLADAENDLYNIRLNATNDYAEKIVQARADMLDKLKELDERAAEDEEYRLNQYENDKANIQKAYYDLIDDYSRLHTIAQEEDVRVQQDAWTNFYSDVIDQGEDWKNAITDYNNKIILSFEEWEAKSDLLTEAIAEDITDITDASENLKNTLVEDVIPTMADTLDEVRTLTAEYALQRESVLDLADAYGVLAGNIKDAIREEAQKAKNTNSELQNTDTTKDPNVQLQETRPADVGPGSSSSSSSSGGDGVLNVGDEVTFTGGVYYNDSEGGGPTGSRGPGKKVRVDRIKLGSNYPIHVISGDSAFGWLREDQLSGFNTGGYTGEWGAEGKLALLHEKELVLNAVDTENLLASVQILRELTKAIDLNATWASMGIGSLNAVGVSDTSTTLEQKVEIRAEFPNATDHNEIEEAFNTLINRASQYANRF